MKGNRPRKILMRQCKNAQSDSWLRQCIHLTEERVDEAMDEQGWVEKSQEILSDIKAMCISTSGTLVESGLS
jgi:hypothetical protein